MTVREIVVVGDPVLRRKAKKVNKISAETRKLIEDMIETMREAPGVGLAAPQVGVSERVIVVEYAEDEEAEPAETEQPVKKKLYTLVNPEIAWTSEEMIEGSEGCLSIPGWIGEVMRHEAVVVKGVNREGHKVKIKADGWLARIFQHEIDHLDGVLYTDRLISPDAFRRWPPPEEEGAPKTPAQTIG
jgi:peptide deformylase